MTANIETLLDWMRQRVEHDQAAGTAFTHAHLVTLLDHIAKLTSDIDRLKDIVALYNNIIAELSTPRPKHVELISKEITSDPT